ncbi:MAG: hypothetical protein GY705_20400, partial [Bacteroidetes bacterium]|nr:hypothetical protein [Bacteroidota bacterium]
GEYIAKKIVDGPIEIEIKKPSKKREQEAKYHAMIADIARTVLVRGVRYSSEVWKALLVDGYEKERIEMGEPLSHPGRTIKSLDGQRYITIRASTKDFRIKEAADFIEYLYSEGIEMGASFSDPVMKHYEEMMAR